MGTDVTTQAHARKAKAAALRILMFTGVEGPPEWWEPHLSALAGDLFEFAFHARCVNWLCKLANANVPDMARPIPLAAHRLPDNWEICYQRSLDLLARTRAFEFGIVKAEVERPHPSVKDAQVALYVCIRTDDGEASTIGLDDLIGFYFSRIALELRQLFPGFDL
jgi:hypothetical protein